MSSAILSPDTRPHWELIQHSEGGTAALLRRFEEYTNTLAENMRKTYLSPFTFVTPHLGEPEARRDTRQASNTLDYCSKRQHRE